MDKKSINKNGFEVGDKVVRYRNGSNNGKGYNDSFIITKISSSYVYDENNCAHNSDNIKLVTPKSEIINNYEIF